MTTTYHLSNVPESNLEAFYTVQQYSGAAVTIFKSQEDAENARSNWISELETRFEQGDSSVMAFSLDSDLCGGCVQTNSIASHLWPGPIDQVSPWDASYKTYQDCDGASLVSWGSPALQRPDRFGGTAGKALRLCLCGCGTQLSPQNRSGWLKKHRHRSPEAKALVKRARQKTHNI